MHSCPRCGAEWEEEALFCQQCGEPLSQPSEPPRVEPVPSAAVSWPDTRDAGPELPIPENIAAVIAYITIIPAIVFAYVAPFRRNLFVRFHAFQHIFLFVVAVVSAVVASILWMMLQLIPFMRVLIIPFAGLIALAWFFLWLLLLVKAYHHEWFKLPILGDVAEDWATSDGVPDRWVARLTQNIRKWHF
jgi:uncharacterized membrane protein